MIDSDKQAINPNPNMFQENVDTKTTVADQNSSEDLSKLKVWDECAALEFLESDRELLDDMIGMFLTDLPKQLSELSVYLDLGDLQALGNTAHTIKGAVGYFYASSAIEAARVLEKTAREVHSADFKGLTAILISALTDLKQDLQQYIDQKCS